MNPPDERDPGAEQASLIASFRLTLDGDQPDPAVHVDDRKQPFFG